MNVEEIRGMFLDSEPEQHSLLRLLPCHLGAARAAPPRKNVVFRGPHPTRARLRRAKTDVSQFLLTLSGRRSNELAWLRAEVDRIRELAERVNREGSAGVASDLDLVLTRFDVTRIKPLLVSVFGFIDKNPAFVEQIHALVERCERVDTLLAPVAAFAVLPRDRSYSGASTDWRAFLRENAPQIAIQARLVVRWIEELR